LLQINRHLWGRISAPLFPSAARPSTRTVCLSREARSAEGDTAILTRLTGLGQVARHATSAACRCEVRAFAGPCGMAVSVAPESLLGLRPPISEAAGDPADSNPVHRPGHPGWRPDGGHLLTGPDHPHTGYDDVSPGGIYRRVVVIPRYGRKDFVLVGSSINPYQLM